MKRSLFTALKLIFFFGLGVLLIWLSLRGLTSDDKAHILESFRNAKYHWVILGMCVGVGSHYLRALRWNLLIDTFTTAPKASSTFYAVMAGYLANLAIPRLGEITRCSILYKTDKIPVEKSLGTVITERSIDLLTFATLFVITLFVQFSALDGYMRENILPGFKRKMDFSFDSNTLIIIAIALLLLVIIIIFLRRRLAAMPLFTKTATLLKGFLHGILSVVKVKKPWLFIAYTLLIWVMYFLMIYLCFFSLQATSHLGLGAGLAVLVLGTIGIIITPGGIGLYPIIIAEALILYNTSYNDGFALGWITWTSQTLLIVILGILSLVLSMSKTRKYAGN